MATRTITAMFDTYAEAATAVSRLEQAGVPHSDISIVSNDPAHRSYLEENGDNTGTATGASLGTVLGGGAGLLAGLGMLAIPGLGPVVAAGWLASTLVGAGVGAAAGGVVGALTDAGVSHEDAHAYAEGVSRGGTLVTVKADEATAAQAANILDSDGTIDMNQRETDWRSAGWTGTYAGTDPITGGTPLATPGAMPAAGIAPAPPLSSGAAPLSDDNRRRVRVYGDGI